MHAPRCTRRRGIDFPAAAIRSRVLQRPRSQGQPEFNRKMLQKRIFHISPVTILIPFYYYYLQHDDNECMRIASHSTWEIEHDLLLRWTNCAGSQSDAPWSLDRNCANGFRHHATARRERVDRCISTIHYVLNPRAQMTHIRSRHIR